MCNLHFMVIDHGCQMIGWQTVGFHQNLIVELFVICDNVTTQMIMGDRPAFLIHLEANGMGFAICNSFYGFIGRKSTTGSVIMRIFLALHLLLTSLFQLLRRTKTGIGMPLVN